MKKNALYVLTMIVGLIFASCTKEDTPPVVIEQPLYGMQIVGSATADEAMLIDADQMIEPGSDFSIKEKRSGMYYGIHYLNAGSFTFKNVTPAGEMMYGATEVAEATQEAETVDPFTFQRGTLTEGGSEAFTVATAGLYYIITDEISSYFWVIPVESFDVSGTETKTEIVSAGAEEVVFTAKNAPLKGKTKFRINTAWKLIAEDVPYTGTAVTVEDHIRPVLSFGGALDLLTPEGDDIDLGYTGTKALDITLTWTPGDRGMNNFKVTWAEGTAEVAQYPENMYIIGGSAGGWTWTEEGVEGTDITMHPVHSNDNLFWAIVWLDAYDGDVSNGIKFNTKQSWGGDFGATAKAGSNTDGVGVSEFSGDNIITPAVSGYYMVVVDMDKEEVLIKEPEVFLIGDTTGAWDAAQEAFKFTTDVENQVMTFTGDLTAANLRMYAGANFEEENWMGDWWQSEFVFYGNETAIEYREKGDDQAGFAIDGGNTTIKLNFKTGMGYIANN